MKFYDFKLAPSPRKVRMFIAEKGLDIPSQEINLRELEQFKDEFRQINPRCTVPALALDDGTVLTESEAICRYLEDIHPEPALFGRTPLERAEINEWIRQIELDGYMAVAEALRNSAPFFKDRALPGPQPISQIPELAERGRQRTQQFFSQLNERLHHQPQEWLAGDYFSMADIMAFIVIDFSKRLELQPEPGLAALHSWYQRVSARPSAQL